MIDILIIKQYKLRQEDEMSEVRARRRGTVILEIPRGILLTGGYRAGRERPFILPGGGAERGESRFVAALRELTEETHLRPYYAEIIFRHLGKVRPTISGRHKFQDHHTVCLVRATGFPWPGGGDAKRIAYYTPGCNIWISRTTREIIERYYTWKNKKERFKVLDEDESDAEDVVGEAASGYDEDE
jgi:8-oxo-dGTP diphosphatase